jgi:PAS domain S-box-containing protein
MDRRWQLKFWGLIGAFIGLAIGLAVVLATALQAARSIEDWNQEYVTWHASQVELEFWRLLETATLFVSGVADVDRTALDLRIDILFSRINVFDGGVIRERLTDVAGAGAVIDNLRTVMTEQEPVIRSLSPGDFNTLSRVRAELVPIEPSLRNLVVSFEFFETNGAIAEVQALRGLFILGAVLVAALLVTGIALIVFLLVEIRVRRKLLESVLASRELARAAREREEAALLESGRRFRAIAMANPVALLVLHAEDGAIRYANPAAVALLGLPESEPITMRACDFFVDPTEFEAVVKASVRGTLDHFDARLRRLDGSEVPVSISARPLVYDDANCVVVGALDLTEKQAAQVEIERQREIIYHREKLGALGSLLAGVAHELNNPLSIVVAQATLLEEAATDPQTATRGVRIKAAAERCARIVKTFLAMARQRPPSRGAVDVNQSVTAALELLGYGLRSAGVEVNTSLAANLPTIWADPDQISQVLTNLVVNAQQAMVEWSGSRRLTITTRFDTGHGQVILSVADSGPGVPAVIRSRIFEPFFTTKPVGIGTGIGLSVSHSVVTSHGGTIEVRDAFGGGAEFVVRLPVGAEEQRAAAPVDDRPATLSGGRVLIIDDEPEVAEALADILASANYRIDVAGTGPEALERLEAGDYAAILSDMRMPGMDGMELYHRLNVVKPAMARCLVFVTGDALNPAVLEFLDYTGCPHIEKPFVPVEVRRMVAAIAAAGSSTPRAEPANPQSPRPIDTIETKNPGN